MAAGAARELGQRAPAGPRHQQLTPASASGLVTALARMQQRRARLLQQLGGAVSDRDLRGETPWRAAASSRTSRAPGSG